MLRDQLVKALEEASGVRGVNLDIPTETSFGDYSSNVALRGRIDADKLAEKLNQIEGFPARAEVKSGFINLRLTSDVLVDNLIEIGKQRNKYGRGKFDKKKVMVEFTDPNPFKEFHIGHLYTNTVGEAISRILEAAGSGVKRANYQGDVGLHVAKAIWGIRKLLEKEGITLAYLEKKDLKARIKFLGEAYSLGAKAYENEKAVKSEIEELNTEIFAHAKGIKEVYEKGRAWSLEYFEEIYKRLGTKFDYYYFESKVGEVGEKIVKDGLTKGIFVKSKGAIIFPGSKYGLHDRVFINSMGLPTYEAKELGLAPTKHKDFAYDQSIIITGNEINEYFKVLIKVMSLIYPDLGKATMHIGHGMVRLPEGKMSSRTGEVITAEELLDKVKAEAAKINKDSAEDVTIAAVKCAFLKVGIGKDIVYDVGESLSLEGNSGPYLQYTAVRANSVITKANTKVTAKLKADSLSEEEMALLRSLVHFPEIIEISAKLYSPNLLCNYLFDLASRFNTFYNKERIIGSENEEMKLAITSAVSQVLTNGLNLLGIEVPEKM